ncbi:alpha-glucan family phosphorylase [Blastopirellula retiformator]|uniref:Carbohydrate phosphorylase n=1 Tax=Blastopirellula retiformator TaxID=2527970 RepID=A0A5C5VMZ9_9BACT|nr:alpha-glucan family phosphorylase [Blastopirellula retiformator]TWT39380.1 Carbohydrate phosphorylase [Blastopirellula retiformator]
MSQAELTQSESDALTGVVAELSAEKLYDKCMELANNLWWTWQPDVFNLFRDLDPIRWRQLDHNPIALLKEFTPERLELRAAEMVLYSRINHAYRRLKEYLTTKDTWSATHAGVLGSRPVAYFSAEFGIHESLPIYSGGLGVLSGDHVKSASGLGVPLIAMGLFYDQGYFKQHLDVDGYQHEEYMDTKVENLPMKPALSPDGTPITVSLETRSGTLQAKVWKMNVGRVKLFLLDCDVDGNNPEDRELTSRLYGGDERTRIRQELVLGVGGMRALKALGITPGVYHLNEGHSAFAPLEGMRERIVEDGMAYDDALREVARQTVFTTHTPVPAGHDRFDAGLIEEHLGPLRDSMGVSHDQLMGLGRVEPQNPNETFCMTVLGLKLSRRANAVSQLHGHVSRRMWAHLWPWRVEEEIPIGHITNGVHVPSWVAWQMLQLYDRHFPSGWYAHMGEPDVWQYIHNVDPGELWETHATLKNLLLQFVRRRVSRQCRRRGESDDAVERARTLLDPNILTIGFARRFATYKRADLFLEDLDRLDDIVNSTTRPVQFIFSGKAHPKDEPGKAKIRDIFNLRNDERFRHRIVFVEDYDINVARHLIQGVDVWLNNPRRPLEASGTSGQKVVLNGGLNCSILDGWWAEAHDGANGFAIGNGRVHSSVERQDERDGAYLYQVLENEVIPLFYDRDADGLPHEWIKRMMNSIGTLGWRFSAHRMVMDYTRHAYVPAAGGLSCDMSQF